MCSNMGCIRASGSEGVEIWALGPGHQGWGQQGLGFIGFRVYRV